MEIVGVVGQLTTAEVLKSVAALEGEVDELPPLPKVDPPNKIAFDKRGFLPFELLVMEALVEYPGELQRCSALFLC
jgi:hypothetical protein